MTKKNFLEVVAVFSSCWQYGVNMGFFEKTCSCALSKGGIDGLKMFEIFFTFLKLNYKQKPFERTLLELLGTTYGCFAPF